MVKILSNFVAFLENILTLKICLFIGFWVQSGLNSTAYKVYLYVLQTNKLCTQLTTKFFLSFHFLFTVLFILLVRKSQKKFGFQIFFLASMNQISLKSQQSFSIFLPKPLEWVKSKEINANSYLN